jgi:hypothetical protein
MSVQPPTLGGLLALIGEQPETVKEALNANWQELVALCIVQGAGYTASNEWNDAHPEGPYRSDLPITLEHLERSALETLQELRCTGAPGEVAQAWARLLPRLSLPSNTL